MAFRLKPDESVNKGIKRLARREVDRALGELKLPRASRDDTIHDARKRFKKVRALLRLVRDDLGEKVYQRENTFFRDAARPLTEVRDARVLIESLDKLTDHFAEQVSMDAFAAVRKGLQAHRREVRQRVLQDEDSVTTVTATVDAARDRIRDWKMNGKGWSALQSGLKQVYKQGRRAFAAAVDDPTVETLHEWRKQAKYLWHLLQVLEAAWPAILAELANQTHELTQMLGDDHDLAVLREQVTADPDKFVGDSTLETLLALIDRRRDELQQAALPLGRRLYSDRPSAFTDRIQSYWSAWRKPAAPVRA
jgi:CHAD domain-containing protein